jgi:PAS domain S-box-containing protein
LTAFKKTSNLNNLSWEKQMPDDVIFTENTEEYRIDKDRYRVFIEDAADGFYETDLRGNFKFFNNALCRIFGYSADEIRNHNYREFMDRKNAGIAFERFNGIYQSGRSATDISWEIIRKDGERRFLEISSGLITDDSGQKLGFRGIARDITAEKRAARTNQMLFRISGALPRFRILDELLEFIIKEVQEIIAAEGASVILIDEEKKEFFFRVATYDDRKTGKILKEIRFPLDKGVAGYVYRTGQPLIVPDTSQSPFFLSTVDERSGYQTRNMLDVPVQNQEQMIGVLCAVNKKQGSFDLADVEILSAIAATVALPIENTRIAEELSRSYKEVRTLNRAKERVIHHLSHELKTPLSVLDASLELLNKKCSDISRNRILERARRNLDRILEMQYEIEDILRERTYRVYRMLSSLLDACTDELEVFFECEMQDRVCCIEDVLEIVRHRVRELFGPRDAVCQEIRISHFVEETIRSLVPCFAHRQIDFRVLIPESHARISIPPDVLAKITEGLIRNAVENTPDGGRIEVSVPSGKQGIELEVRDFGVGITEESQRFVFENIFTTRETLQYSSRKPYDFNAGGKGLDLLRMKIFSERYHFNIRMTSKRCRFIPNDSDNCPGKTQHCTHCRTQEDCLNSGGTTMRVCFSFSAS